MPTFYVTKQVWIPVVGIFLVGVILVVSPWSKSAVLELTKKVDTAAGHPDITTIPPPPVSENQCCLG